METLSLPPVQLGVPSSFLLIMLLFHVYGLEQFRNRREGSSSFEAGSQVEQGIVWASGGQKPRKKQSQREQEQRRKELLQSILKWSAGGGSHCGVACVFFKKQKEVGLSFSLFQAVGVVRLPVCEQYGTVLKQMGGT